MSEQRIRIARMLVTIPAVFLAFGPAIADLNATHVTNPHWPSHARLHTVWLVCTNSLVALLALAILWRRAQQPEPGAVRLATALVGAVLIGFFVAAATQSAYGGALTDPNGIPFRIGPLDANLAAFSACGVLLTVAWVLARKPPKGGAHLAQITPGAKLVGREVLEIEPDTGVVRLAFLARPEFANRHGTVAGGFLAAMLDSTTAAPILAFLSEELTIVTTDLRVSYLRPAPLGRLLGSGRVSERNEREIHAEGELSDPEGNAVARATATFRIRRRS